MAVPASTMHDAARDPHTDATYRPSEAARTAKAKSQMAKRAATVAAVLLVALLVMGCGVVIIRGAAELRLGGEARITLRHASHATLRTQHASPQPASAPMKPSAIQT